jgi:hypothetical protein
MIKAVGNSICEVVERHGAIWMTGWTKSESFVVEYDSLFQITYFSQMIKASENNVHKVV